MIIHFGSHNPSLRGAKRRACALKRYGAQAWQFPENRLTVGTDTTNSEPVQERSSKKRISSDVSISDLSRFQ
jgi:hypothetical protein